MKNVGANNKVAAVGAAPVAFDLKRSLDAEQKDLPGNEEPPMDSTHHTSTSGETLPQHPRRIPQR